MEPIIVITWACVAIFIVTAILTLFHISGLYILPNENHGKTLFRALILEVVIIAVATFGTQITSTDDPDIIPDLCAEPNPPLTCILEK